MKLWMWEARDPKFYCLDVIISDGRAQLCEVLCKILQYTVLYGLVVVQMWQPGKPHGIDYGNFWMNCLLKEENFILMNR